MMKQASQSVPPRHRLRALIRRGLFWLVFVAATIVIVRAFTDLEGLASTLRQWRWPWVLAAVGLQALFYLLYAFLYRHGFLTVEVDSPVGELLPLVFVALFVNGVAPTAGAAPAALFVEHARRRGQSGGGAAIGTLLVLAADLVTLIPFVVAAMVFLVVRGALQFYDIIAGIMFGVYIGALLAALLFARWRPRLLRALLERLRAWAGSLARRLRRPAPFAHDWPGRTAQELEYGSRAVARHPLRLLRTLAIALALHAVNLAGLYTLFLGFAQPVGLWTLIAGFGVSVVFWIVSITPQEINAAEGIMALVYTTLGIAGSKAIVVALAFRALNFWLPLVIGALLFQRAGFFRRGRTAGTGSGEGEPFDAT